jgi:Flp pilus assembly protein TadB
VRVGQAVTLQVARANVAAQLKRNNTGALARIWQVQQEKEEAWMRSLLEGLEADDQYINAKREVAKAMGLRAEELDDELEVQELEDLHGRLNEVRALARVLCGLALALVIVYVTAAPPLVLPD